MPIKLWFEKQVLNGIRKRLALEAVYPSVVEHRGATFVLDPSNWIDNRLIAKIPYEVAQIDRAMALLEEHDIDMFIDIGANFGLYSILIGTNARILEVIAVEPMSRNYNQLLANVFANRLDGKVRARNCAIDEISGHAVLHIDPNSTGLSRLDLLEIKRDPSVFRTTETVETIRFDDAFPVTGRNALVKIDVEGHACKVLKTMTAFFANNSVVLQIELSDTEHDGALTLLSAMGYREFDHIDGDYYFSRSA
jgi:FkbM family methyltransferase